jgi:hypothetical protein
LRDRFASIMKAKQYHLKHARPNPSLKRSVNGVALGPRGALVHHAPHGPSTTPLAPA